ncbi:MAG: hypothetical protein H7Z39_16405 [Burkholderiaceae bacterium]|nr:hypothetical protein [Burkholderiaceae bacterium]
MQDQGLYNKFNVTRADGRHAAGEKHADCEYFVLDVSHDKHALPALIAYADSCEADYPLLSADLRSKATASIGANNAFVTVPETTLPGGQVVPSFQVGQYLCAKGPMGIPQVAAMSQPWVEINYAEARQACAAAGLSLITELQALAIAHDIVNQGINWAGGAVGEGKVFQGLHKGSVNSAQHGDFVSDNPEERRWHQLSNGARVFDFAGNAYSWVFDDVQGDEQGLIAKPFADDSPSIATAPYPSMENGMGWRPDAGADWSGNALVRGGCWNDGDCAGAFLLDDGWPDLRRDDVGFRCTKPSSGL